ncbi:hypothetical protein PF004_g26474 [Phytophthora fragariae]|uniref:Uncharacterized protein n=1 Tax=Phytophthora fragariae TaxID=53985 RepID=A0A6G0MP43_9STRA|nr:hypothetical protein PF004_g26474 [Phytophthora fragariae]
MRADCDRLPDTNGGQGLAASKLHEKAERSVPILEAAGRPLLINLSPLAPWGRSGSRLHDEGIAVIAAKEIFEGENGAALHRE